jgi:autotransporter-associated beta strand protein
MWRHSSALGSARILRAGFGILPKPCMTHTLSVQDSVLPNNAAVRDSRGRMPRATRWKRALPIATMLTAFLCGSSTADQTKLPPDPASHTVVVPYDLKKPLKAQKPQRYYLDRESFERLWSLVKENRRPEKPDDADEKPAATIHSAAYRTVVEDERLVVEATLEIGTRGAWTTTVLPIKSGDAIAAVVRDWTLDGKPVAVVDGVIQIEKSGVHVVEAVIELNRKPGWKEAQLDLPASLASFVSLSVPATDGRPELEGVDLLTQEQSAGQRVFTAVLGQPDKLKLTRSPRRPLADASPPAVADTELIIGHTSGGAQSLLGSVQFDFPGTERSRFSLAIDADWQIAGWTVTQNKREVAVRHWAAREEPGRRVIDFELDRPAADQASISIWGTRSSATGALRTPALEPGAVKGQHTIALLHDETIKLVPQPAGDQRRIDRPVNVRPAMSGGRGKTTELFFRMPARQTLAYTIEPAPAKWESRTDYVFQLSEQKQEMMAAVTLKREQDAWSQLRIGLPAGFEIQSVNGPALASWKQEKDDLFLQFNPASATGEARLLVYLATTVPQPLTIWPVEPLRFNGFEKIDGSAVIVAHAATEARLSDFQASPDLQEADPATVSEVFAITPPQEKKRALKFGRGGWTAGVSLSRQPARFSSDGIVLAQATDVGLLVSQQVAFYVEQGALNRVTVKLPAALPEATVRGDALREVQTRVNGEVREYDCSFQSDVLDRAALTFDMELPLAGELSLPLVEVNGVERLRRFFVLDNSSSRESKVIEANGVEGCAKSALPYVPDVLSQPAFYRGKGGAGALRVAYTQLQSTEGNAAIVTLAEITTAWRADGERWDTVVYSVFNRSLQFLPVILPDGAELIGVSVSGESVRADEEKRADGKTVRLIPLIQTRAGQRSLEVRMVYRLKHAGDAPLQKRRTLRMDDPELVGISAERTVWTAIVPKRYTISDVDGNMEEVAEESKAVERLQGLMSDFSRLNKVLASSSRLSKGENEYALKEAEKLAKQIEDESVRVEQLNRSKTDLYYRSKDKEADGDKELALQGKFMQDLGDLQQDLGKQRLVLKENAIKTPVFSDQAETLSLGNTWNFNSAAAQTTKAGREFATYGTPIQTNATDALGNPRAVVLNDNTVVQGGFLNQTASSDESKQGLQRVAGVISGTGGVTVAKAGAGTLTLSGGTNTYTGATTVNAGGLVVSDTRTTASGSMTGGTIKFEGAGRTSETLDAVQRNLNEQSQLSSNARANTFGGTMQLQQGQIERKGDVSMGKGAVQSLPGSAPVAGGVFGGALLPAKPQGVVDLAAVPATAAAMADPFAAPADSDAARRTATRADNSQREAGRAGFDAPQMPQQVQRFDLEAQVASQLRATGRRSLMIEVPSDGDAYHFRKLKDHAVLELKLGKAWTDEQKSTSIWLGAGLGVWLLLSMVAKRRRAASQPM